MPAAVTAFNMSLIKKSNVVGKSLATLSAATTVFGSSMAPLPGAAAPDTAPTLPLQRILFAGTASTPKLIANRPGRVRTLRVAASVPWERNERSVTSTGTCVASPVASPSPKQRHPQQSPYIPDCPANRLSLLRSGRVASANAVLGISAVFHEPAQRWCSMAISSLQRSRSSKALLRSSVVRFRRGTRCSYVR
jgi:hypothetical protein